MTDRTALITGLYGQDGSLLAELLLARGYRVAGVVREPSQHPAAAASTGVTAVSADLTDPAAVAQLLDTWRPDELYHLAAFHHASQDNTLSAAGAGRNAMLSINFLATKTIAFALVEARAACHLVYAASSQMYTARQPTDVIDERSARNPSTFYGHTKSWSLDLLAFLRKESNLRASTAILFNHESVRRGTQFVSRKITVAAAQAALGMRPRLEVYNLAARVDWSSARDVVQALSLMGRSEDALDCVVASGALHSVRDLLDTAFAHVGLDWRSFTTAREDREVPALVGNPDTLQRARGWRRDVSFEAMVAEMVDHDIATLKSA